MKSFRPSDTAKLIARSLVLASGDRSLVRLVPERSVFAIHRIFKGSLFLWALKFAPVRWFFLQVEKLLLPGIITHYLARKSQIEQSVEKAISGGCGRVVILGAGFDTLAWRLHGKHPDVQFVELDHPATQAVKRDRLEHGANFAFRSIDLGVELPSSQLDRDEVSTVFVVEGLTMYFEAGRVEELMRDLVGLTGRGGEIIWTFMERSPGGSLGFWGESSLISKWLGMCREPFLWGISREELKSFAGRCGMAVGALADHTQLRNEQLHPRGLGSLSLAQGELICTSTPINS